MTKLVLTAICEPFFTHTPVLSMPFMLSCTLKSLHKFVPAGTYQSMGDPRGALASQLVGQVCD